MVHYIINCTLLPLLAHDGYASRSRACVVTWTQHLWWQSFCSCRLRTYLLAYL